MFGRYTNMRPATGRTVTAGLSRHANRRWSREAAVRERLLDAALDVLASGGVQQLTQVRVAERAGVRQSHLTYYFPTREDLLEAVATAAVEGMASGLRRAVAAGGPDTVPRRVERLARSIGDRAHMRMFVATIVEADGDAAVRRILQRGTQRMEAAVAEALAVDLPRARLVLAAVWGLGLYRFLMRPGAGADPARPYLTWLAAASATARPAVRRRPQRRRGPANTRPGPSKRGAGP